MSQDGNNNLAVIGQLLKTE
ncbi:hypothetical protein O9929_04400 [Vibrio lentus]|nr:hypothetical protein [Vibrio lentus]